jgi:hypothetical protein
MTRTMHYGASTRCQPGEVLDLAKAFFGRPELGLQVKQEQPDSLSLAGQPGRASVRVAPIDGATEVFMTTEGLDELVRRFMAEILIEERQPNA